MSSWQKETSPFHKGEQALQNYAGVRDRLEVVGRHVIYPEMPDQHREFFAQLPLLFVGGLADDNLPTASMLFGTPGFVESPNNSSLVVNATFLSDDPLHGRLQSGDAIGLLGLETSTRRRNRMNGVVVNREPARLTINVSQAFGNCPQYIEAKDFNVVGDLNSPSSNGTLSFDQLDDVTAQMIRNADRFFVASNNDQDDKYDTGGVDVSHRGGLKGFIKVDENTLTIPDFKGNFAFNTLGNFLINPSAGLLFIDEQKRDIVQLWGQAELILDLTEELGQVPGAQRGWKFHVKRGLRHLAACPFKWRDGEPGPGSERSGIWPQNQVQDQNI